MSTRVEELEELINQLTIENKRMKDHISAWQPHEDPRRTLYVENLNKENEKLLEDLQAAYTEIRKQVFGSKVVFDREICDKAEAARKVGR